MMYLLLALMPVLSILVSGYTTIREDGPECPRFDYEYKVIERLVHLESRYEQLSRRQEELTNLILEQQAQEIDELQDKANTLELKQSSLEKMNVELEDNLTKQQENHDEDIQAINTNVEKLENAISGALGRKNVSFYAIFWSSRQYSSGNTIIFDRVLNNDGDAYNPSTGIFTAPTDGKYLLSITITVVSRTEADVYLMHNDQDKGRVLPDKATVNDWDTASLTSILNLNQGDRVYAKLKYVKNTNTIRNQYTSLTGVLL